MIYANSQNFRKEVIEINGVVFVDFYADWCGPCRMVSPIIDELAQEMTEVKFVKVNVDENADLASQYQIFSIPTFIIFKNGQPVNQIFGFRTKETLREEIKKYLRSNF
ncbi:MAG: thioredoxin [Patescibacteria group bacterium]|nr:thioredoxin [Patescibacteria group bacterium]